MIGVLPSVSNNDLQGFLALVAFSADPKSCADRILELQALASELQDKSDSLAIATQTFNQEKKDVDLLREDLTGSRLAVEETQKNLDSKLKLATDKINEYSSKLRTLKDEYDRLFSDVRLREEEVSKRENSIQSKQEEVDLRLSQATNLRKEFEDKLSQIKALSN